jgi:diacylglycerol kinase (ATP)
VVAAGGDGTVSLIANRTSAHTSIAVFPLGTENLLAKHLGVKACPIQVAEIVAAGQGIALDAGQANGRLFLVMAGVGFDAEVVRRVDQSRTGNIHRLAYAQPILDSIRSYDYPTISIQGWDEKGKEFHHQAKWVFAVNLPRYAAGLRIAPSAKGTDGQLDLCAFKGGSLVSGLTYLTGVIFGQHEKWEDCIQSRAVQLVLESQKPVPYQLDGDPGGKLPVKIGVLPGRLRVLVPPQFAERSK